MPRIDNLPLGTPRPTDYAAHDSADGGARRATIAEQVGAGAKATALSATLDDFTDGGGAWSVDTFASVGRLAALSPLMPSSGVVSLGLGTSDGTMAAKGWGRQLGTGGPLVIEWRSTLPLTGGVVTDTQCEYAFGVVAGPDSGVLFSAAWVTSARVWRLVTINAGTPTPEALTLNVAGKTYFDVRLTIGLMGTLVEISLDDGPFTTLLTGATAPDQVTYVPAIFGAKITTPALDRSLCVDSVAWIGPELNNAGELPAGGDPWPTTPPHATSHEHGGADEIATATPAANAIPKADGAGKLDAWITDTSTPIAFPSPVTESTAARTLADADNGKTIYVTHAGECTITVPQTLTPGFSCAVQNVDAAATTTWVASGTQALKSPSSFTKNTVRYALSGVIVRSTTHAALSGALDS